MSRTAAGEPIKASGIPVLGVLIVCIAALLVGFPARILAPMIPLLLGAVVGFDLFGLCRRAGLAVAVSRTRALRGGFLVMLATSPLAIGLYLAAPFLLPAIR